jgi:hypothetical protein
MPSPPARPSAGGKDKGDLPDPGYRSAGAAGYGHGYIPAAAEECNDVDGCYPDEGADGTGQE